MTDLKKIPLGVAWMSEEGILTQMMRIKGYSVIDGTATMSGVDIQDSSGKPTLARWEDTVEFTVNELIQSRLFQIGDK